MGYYTYGPTSSYMPTHSWTATSSQPGYGPTSYTPTHSWTATSYLPSYGPTSVYGYWPTFGGTYSSAGGSSSYGSPGGTYASYG